MDKRHIPVLAVILETYSKHEELEALFDIFDLKSEWDDGWYHNWSWFKPARQLIEQVDHGNHRALLSELLEAADLVNSGAVAHTSFERREFHSAMTPKIQELKNALGATGAPSELAIGEAKPFSAKSEMRDFIEQAKTPVLVVDPYVGVGTLDCLRSTTQPVRLLTGENAQAIEPGFENGLMAFVAEGFTIEVRQHPKLHDRHIAFNDRCWLVGSSLKDAGKKAFHAIEIVDAKGPVSTDLESKWKDGKAFP